jgi:alpha,alpha-trehalase
VLARSDRPRSWRHFQRALDSDISDVQGGTTPEGIHVGAMAGTIDLIQRCFIGIEMRANALHFDPALPDDLRQIKVRLRYRRQLLDIEVDHDTLRIGSRSFTSVPIKVAYRGHYRDLAPGEVCQFRLLKPEGRDRDENRTMGAAKEAKR